MYDEALIEEKNCYENTKQARGLQKACYYDSRGTESAFRLRKERP